ncbi:MAG: hypothetical protein K2N28_07055 [Muribaculaceae bacterium]|nr:hypothetical protein [Muribaculaceae bacterium]
MKTENKNDNLPVMMYLHGFMSGANGAKQRQLQRHFKGRYRVIAPELTANPVESLKIINALIEEENPEIIIGTSLGGWMAIECNIGLADVIVINPSLTPQTSISRWRDQEQTYFCKRLDGVQTYTLTQDILDLYKDYDAISTAEYRRLHISALCSSADELLGDSHYTVLREFLPNGYCKVVNDFGHQCRDAGMPHLYELIEKVIARRKQIADNMMTFEEFKEMVRTRPTPDTPGCYRLKILRTDNPRVESGYYATKEDAEAEMLKRACNDKELTFKIDRIGFGQVASVQFPVEEWLCDCEGKLLEQASCSSFHYQQPGIYGKFFGHVLSPRRPFMVNQYVTVRNRQGQSVLGIVLSEGLSLDWGYRNYRWTLDEWIREGNQPDEWVNTTLFPGSDEDEYFVQFGPFTELMENFAFFHPMNMTPVQRMLSDEETADLKKWHRDYLDYLDSEKNSDNDNSQN